MSPLDDLRSILACHHQHVTSQTNQGTAHLLKRHLKQLDDASGDAEAGTAAAHQVLGELYDALNAPAPETPAPAAQTKATTKKAADTPPTA